MEEQNKVFQRVVSVTQTFLVEALEKGSVTPALIAEKVDFVATHMAPGENIDRKEAVAELIRRFSLWIGGASTLSDKTGHKDWLNAARRRDWRYWQRYRDFLESKMSVKAVDALDEATNKILELLEDPLREEGWDRRGLVVGHVQSGKTGNYTGLICKAADAGYKIIIVLAGLHNNLRSQTQIRLEEGFLGYETSAKNDVVRYIGVGENGRDAEIRPNCATNRSDNGDFNTKVAKHLAISPEQRPWLFVVKKNKIVLDRLLKWIRNHVADSKDAEGRPLVSGFPLLLIDDEADHASVDTGDQVIGKDGAVDDEYQPKAINSRIRKILHSFSRKAYVGYTATPFANIFIDRRKATKEEGPDLFPQSFIINISAPSNYVGPARVFGLRATEGRAGGLPLTREVDDQADETGEGGWMPPRHDKNHVPLYKGLDEVPPSLREAVSSFVLVCAVRLLRGQGRRHCSMLIHVTRYTAVQEEVRRQVEELVKNYRQRVERGFEKNKLMVEWKRLWESDFVPTSAAVATAMEEASGEFDLPRWEEVEAVLADVLGDLASSVRAINGSAGDVLDYAEREETGLKVIAVGGDKLARGLTLEGLCVSYFVRTTKMYDTLMQMGRWFGYRPGYLDLCRLYTSSDLVEWFGHITDAAEELRQEFDTMAKVHATPENYGMKVQSHPVLMVTSPIKMRSAKSLQVSFCGSVLETVAFHRDSSVIKRNLAVMERLLDAAGTPAENGEFVRQRGEACQEWKGFLWDNIPAEHVIEFFSGYLTHPAARKVNSAVLADFVKVMAAKGELTSWTIALIGGGEGASSIFCGKHVLGNMITRNQNPASKGEHYSIGRLLSPRDESIDLDEDAWMAALSLTVEDRMKDPARGTEETSKDSPKAPSGVFVRQVRGLGAKGIPGHPERGLLLLYPIDPKSAGLPDDGLPITAFGVSFPASCSATTVKYEVDHLLWETEYAPVY
ncbi:MULTISPECIES: Z1 domain-containing protein [Pseudomonas]|uniref:Z1 domain-containing protein n=1 Tax=Pseudomonas TaxID=286 RepID=UPI0010715319|nr:MULTISPECIES: Z1 domain-containing protein [Pseudomonas]QBR33407.1 endonuclease [Pseudomonas sp. S150]UZT91592.1 Z1 domain-containing protein [Pseudomonas koreensis]